MLLRAEEGVAQGSREPSLGHIKAMATVQLPAEILAQIRSLPPDEVLDLLAFSYYGSAQIFGTEGTFSYTGPTDPKKPKHTLRLETDKNTQEILKGTLESAPGADIDSEISALSSAVKSWVESYRRPLIRREEIRIAFCNVPVGGAMAYPPYFRISAPPADAPLPQQILADWPIVVTFSYLAPDLNHWWKGRIEEAWRDVILLLNLIVSGGIRSQGPPYTTWGFPQDAPLKSQFIQTGYHHKLNVANFAIGAPISTPIPELPWMQLHSWKGFGIESLTVPDDFRKIYDQFLALKGDDRERFISSLRHLQIAGLSQTISSTYRHIALVSAVETLSDYWGAKHWPSGTCKDCGQAKHSAMKKFREFLRAYVVPDQQKLYNAFQSVRSRALHRGDFMQTEQGNAGDWRASGADRTMEIQIGLLARVAITNWLGNPSATPIADTPGAT